MRRAFPKIQANENTDLRSWNVEKYTRLSDIRNNPMEVEGKPPDVLVTMLELKLNLLMVCHNGRKLEEVCVSPLRFAHDVICKENRVLICVKSQVDGRTNGKFRLRFPSTSLCQSFCMFMSNFLQVVGYDEWFHNTNSQSSSQMMHSSSYMESTLPGICRYDSQPIRNVSQPISDASQPIRDVSQPIRNVSQPISDASQTKVDAAVKSTVKAEPKEFLSVGVQTDPVWAAQSNCVININIASLVSDEAAARFTSMCQSLIMNLRKPARVNSTLSKPRAPRKNVGMNATIKKSPVKKAGELPKKQKKIKKPLKWSKLNTSVKRSVPTNRRKTGYKLRGNKTPVKCSKENSEGNDYSD